MTSERRGLALTITDFVEEPTRENGFRFVILKTTLGSIRTVHFPVEGASLGVVLLGGSGGGFDSPALDLYHDLAIRLGSAGLTVLHLRYRLPGDIDQCTMDALAGVAYLTSLGASGVSLIGHGFGGAVAINAGALSPTVRSVATLATQSYGTDRAAGLAPRPLLLLHGQSDLVVPPAASTMVAKLAGDNAEVVILPHSSHLLDEARVELLDRLTRFLTS